MRSADDLRLAADLRHCHAVLRRGSRSFAAAARLLPAGMRDAFAAVYAFCRSADDAVDSARADRGTLRVLSWRLDRVYGEGDGTMLAGDYALHRTVRAYGLPRAHFDALLEGFAWEVAGRRYETESDLLAYAARVASCVGAMTTVLMGRRDPETIARACDLGAAMQLTNIARDVGEDARAGRLYLPRAWMREEGIDPDAFLAHPVFTPALGRVVRRLLETADGLYRRADAGIGRLPARCRPAIRASRLVYADIGRVIAGNGFDSVNRRARTSGPRKALLLARALAAPGPAAAPAAPPLAETRFLVEAAASGFTRVPLALAGRPVA
jgi:phytoene synthase